MSSADRPSIVRWPADRSPRPAHPLPTLAAFPLPGGWTRRRVQAARRVFTLLVPADPEAVLAHLEAGQAAGCLHLADPYWARLWPAAEHLARAVLEVPFGGGRVLELGCGSGLVGLAALALGRKVTFSDYVPLAVSLALENAQRHGFASAEGLVLDWRAPLPRQFDWILAADVLYDRQHLGPLLDLLDRMLAPGGQAWFGDAGRSPARAFLQAAADRGWLVSLYDENHRPAGTPALGDYQRIVLKRPEGVRTPSPVLKPAASDHHTGS